MTHVVIYLELEELLPFGNDKDCGHFVKIQTVVLLRRPFNSLD